MLSPRSTYAALVRERATLSAAMALRRPLLVTIVMGVSVSIAATGRATPRLVAATTLTWSYIVLLQIAIALPLIAAGARRTVGLARALDLFFAGHAPWSLLMLTLPAWSPWIIGHGLWPIAVLAIAPVLLTLRIVSAFFAEVLAMDPADARRLTVLHQGLTWTAFVAILWTLSALTPRVLEFAGLA